MKGDDATRNIPVLVVSQVEDGPKARALGADAYHLKPVDRRWLVETLRRLTHGEPSPRMLIVDDDSISRYVLKQLLWDQGEFVEAGDGLEGLRCAREADPRVIFLDLKMPGVTGFEILDRLKDDPATRAIPVVVITSLDLSPEDRRKLEGKAECVLSKHAISRERALSSLQGALQRPLGSATAG